MATKRKNSKNVPLRQQDPFLAREKTKYDNPLPSREFILEILEKNGVPMHAEELAAVFPIYDNELDLFERRLRAMERAGQVLINRKGDICVAQKLDLIPCRISGHRDGFGFAMREAGDGDDIFLSEREMRKAMHGDRVMVRIAGTDRRGRQEGRIAEIIERRTTRLIGRIYKERGVWFVVPEDRRINHEMLVEAGGEDGASDGQVVMVDIVDYPDEHRQAIVRVTEVLGEYADPGMEIEIALRKHDLPHVFSDEALAQAKATSQKVGKRDSKGRVDLRDLPLVTIDGETARDFDDAVYAEKSGKGYRLIVAIADVSHYVRPGDALDIDARERSTSVYFPRRVIPMLPEELSNGICSLNPDVDRLCMVCDMQISARGKVKKYQFYPAVMRSQCRFTYTQVWQLLSEGGKHKLKPQLEVLYALFQQLLEQRQQRGAVDFDTTETQMLFDDNGKISQIVPVVRNNAHRLIEECMLAANVCAAEFILKHEHKGLFRVHEGPTPEKLEQLQNFLRLKGLQLSGGDKPTTKDYAALADAVRERPDASMIQTMLLRSMQQAVYQPDNLGHFGLSYDAYTHFTSPIRRYPDLLVHRTIKAVLDDKKYKPGKWEQLGMHCSMAERRADDASRDVQSWLKTYYMRDKVGEVFRGKISAVAGFGIFVLLDELYVEGMVHISELGRDYFHFHKEQQAIIGEKSGLKYQLGDPVTIRVVRAELDTAQVEFALVNPERAGDGDVGRKQHGRRTQDEQVAGKGGKSRSSRRRSDEQAHGRKPKPGQHTPAAPAVAPAQPEPQAQAQSKPGARRKPAARASQEAVVQPEQQPKPADTQPAVGAPEPVAAAKTSSRRRKPAAARTAAGASTEASSAQQPEATAPAKPRSRARQAAPAKPEAAAAPSAQAQPDAQPKASRTRQRRKPGQTG
ncbi:ribonuclease R [Vogesella amnigena]|uniref:Ribonuclease R n=1 Tax=Vogesella amnigena TaxID=1507449 RepID=A0ABV7TSS7_9NEIS